jgi:hypothetical protein
LHLKAATPPIGILPDSLLAPQNPPNVLKSWGVGIALYHSTGGNDLYYVINLDNNINIG